MQPAVSLLCLTALLMSGAAQAQQPESPSAEAAPASRPADAPVAIETQPAAPAASSAEAPAGSAAQGPVETPAARARRHSNFSAGSGGALFIFTEVISGLVSGAMIGSAYGSEPRSTAYAGALMGGFALGAAASAYQYFVPVEPMESLLVAGGAATGFLAGFGPGVMRGFTTQQVSLLSLLTSQLGILGVLLPSASPGDVSSGDAALVGMSAIYAFAVTGLLQATNAASNNGMPVDITPTLVAPAAGMALGGLLSMAVDLKADRVFKLTVLPTGAGLVLLFVGNALGARGSVVPLGALVGMAATFAITALATAEPPGSEPSVARAVPGLQAIPVPVVMAAGRRNESIAAGPGLLARF